MTRNCPNCRTEMVGEGGEFYCEECGGEFRLYSNGHLKSTFDPPRPVDEFMRDIYEMWGED